MKRLIDGKGRQYSPELRYFCGLKNPVINPGNTEYCSLPFDVPNRTQPSDYTLVFDGRLR